MKRDTIKKVLRTWLIFCLAFCLLPVSAFASKAFTYTDPNSGMTFTVPANWVEEPMNEEREYIDAKFVSNLEEGLCIIFTSEDMFSEDFMEEAELTAFEKLMMSRSFLDNSLMKKADIAEMLGVSEKDVSVVTYGGKEYYSAELVTHFIEYGLSLDIPIVYLLRCENGYMYIFQFGGSSSSEYFQDFEMLVSSAVYPIFEEDDLLTQRRVIGIAFLIMLASLIALFILLHRIRKKKSQAKTSSVHIPIYANQAEGRPNNAYTIIREVKDDKPEIVHNLSAAFCYKCGSKLEPGSRFCHKCGAKVSNPAER